MNLRWAIPIFLIVVCIASARGQNIDSLIRVVDLTSPDTAQINLLNNTAFKFRNNKINEAIRCAQLALSLSRQIEYEEGQASAYGALGLLFYRKGIHDLAVENHIKSLKIYEQLGNKRFIAYRYNDIANIYVEQAFYDRALEYFDKSLKIKKEIGDKDGEVTTLKNIANLYISQKSFDQALKYTQKALDGFDDSMNAKTEGDLYNFLGEIYIYKGNADSAFYYLDKSEQMRRKRKDEYSLPRVYYGKGQMYVKMKQYDKALKAYQEGIAIARKNDIKLDLEKIYLSIFELYQLQHNDENALEAYQMSVAYHDTIFNQKIADKISILQSFYDIENQQAEILVLKKQRQFISYISITVILFSLIIAAILSWNNFQKRQINKVLVEQKAAMEKQKKELEHKNQEITHSITYARRIQNAIFPKENELQEILPESFIFHQAKAIVSGDFCWYAQLDKHKLMIALGDCTGHGVPGAFMSMVGNNLLNKLVVENNIQDTTEILYNLHSEIRNELHQEKTQNLDGMDMAIVFIDFQERTLTYSGAMLPLYYFDKKGELTELKADRIYLGGSYFADAYPPKEFNSHVLKFEETSMFYMLTDGYQDQIGSGTPKKFTTRRLKKLLETIHHLPLSEQKHTLEQTITDWQGDNPQTDDMLLIGFRLA